MKEAVEPQSSTTQNLAPLPTDKSSALDNALRELIFRLNWEQVSPDCKTNVLEKLAANGFNLGAFVNFLSSNYEFYNGVTSHALAAGTIHPERTANILWGAGTTIATIFASTAGSQRTSALTSITSTYFLAFFNPGDISTDTRGINGRNMALLFHEGLHGFGARTNSFYDQDVMSIFGLTGVSGGISDYIQRHCF